MPSSSWESAPLLTRYLKYIRRPLDSMLRWTGLFIFHSYLGLFYTAIRTVIYRYLNFPSVFHPHFPLSKTLTHFYHLSRYCTNIAQVCWARADRLQANWVFS